MFLVPNSIIVIPYLEYLSLILKIFTYQISLQEDLDKSLLYYILKLMSRKKLGNFNDLINPYFQSFICLPQDAKFLSNNFCKVSLALVNIIQPILERLKENTKNQWKTSIIDKSKGYWHWYLFKFKWLVILNNHDVKNQSINEQAHAVLERYLNRILYHQRKKQIFNSKVRSYLCSTCIEYIYLYQNVQCCADFIGCYVELQK